MELDKNNIQSLIDRWLEFREEDLSHLSDNDKKNLIQFDKFVNEILIYVPDDKKESIKKELENLYSFFMDSFSYFNRKYYKCGFKDAFNLIIFGINNDNNK